MSFLFDGPLSQRQPLACSLLEAAVQRGRLAPAYLLVGRADEDKWQIAKQMAAFLNCSNEQKSSAGSCLLRAANGYPGQLCADCRWIADEAHPQAWMVLTGQDSKSGRVSVEKARQLSEELSKTSRYLRLILVPHAGQDSFHRPAANALLKTIEEPGPNCLFLLFAVEPDEVLSTIVSRCQIVGLSSTRVLSGTQQQHSKLEEFHNQLNQAHGQGDFSSIKSATSSLASTLEWSRRLQELAEAEDNPAAVIDLVLAQEMHALGSGAADNPALSWYLNRLLELAEITKDQVEHYVQSKAALDSFAFRCRELSHGTSGETAVEQT